MRFYRILKNFILAVLLSTALLILLAGFEFLTREFVLIDKIDDDKNNGVAKNWVAKWGDKWWERYHRDIDAQYPGGRSNRFHDQYIQDALKRLSDDAWTDYEITNKDYLYDGEWFAVEWFYQSRQPSTGAVQVESTIAFGRIEDDSLRVWIEYFDDMVGNYQKIGAMKLFDKDEEAPYPWPEGTVLKRKYRP